MKLFRITLKSNLILDRLCSTITSKINFYKEDGFARNYTKFMTNNEEIASEIAKCNELEAKYQLCFEVIWITLNHNNIFLINKYCNGRSERYDNNEDLVPDNYNILTQKVDRMNMCDNRNWYNEWDIPLEIFNQAIDDIVELLLHYSKTNRNSYQKELVILKRLKAFRNSSNKDK
jgi:nuclear transport factor 2 (NTF2) superfamily protein